MPRPSELPKDPVSSRGGRPSTSFAVLTAAALVTGASLGCGEQESASPPAASLELPVALPDAFAGRRLFDVAPARHFVLVSIDTLRADHLGCYGYARPTSPELDAFAAESLRFSSVTSAASRTTPSHMSMFTGVLPPVHGQYNYHRSDDMMDIEREALPRTVPMLAERLAAAGFATSAFADAGYVTASAGFDRGFGAFDSRSEPVDAKVDRALSWWLAQPDDGPRRFMFVHTYEVHAPYVPPVEHDLFTDPDYRGKWKERIESLRALDEYAGVDLASTFLPGYGRVKKADRDYLVGLYDGCVHLADSEIGRLLREVRAGAGGDATAFLVTSDHGEAFGEHGSFGHTSLFEEVVHVPFVLHAPGLVPGVVDTPISGVDTMPTVLDVLGLPSPGPSEGRSVLRASSQARTVFAFHAEQTLPNAKQLWRRGTLKVHMPFRRDGWQLFDLVSDPDEYAPIEGRAAFIDGAVGEVQALQEEHARLYDELRRGGTREFIQPSEDELENLRALGYLGDADG